MTAMCDVAFLLLSFFILTTKFKPDEAVTVDTPSSVSAKFAPETDVTLITITKEGKTFLSLDNEEVKRAMAESMNKEMNLGLSPTELQLFTTVGFFGAPINQLKSFLNVPKEQMKEESLPGIPALDSANNELVQWMKHIVAAHSSTGAKFNLILKGDNKSKYPQFRNVIDAFKKNEQFKFQMVTNPESVPTGTDLWKRNMRSSGADVGGDAATE
jgi:biopolymer transport protein ExbD